MKVLGVGTNLFILNKFQNNYTNYSERPVSMQSVDTFTFTGKNIKPIKTVKEFKKQALKRGYHCMYCNIPLRIDDSLYTEWKKAKLFSTPINIFVQNFRKYKNCLHTSEYNIFSFIEYIAKKNPKAKIDTVIKIMSTNANRELLKVQEPIFESIATEASKLPPKNRDAILNLIAKSRYRMLRIPHLEEYSGKELRYKVDNLSPTLSDEKLTKRVKSLSELLTMPSIYRQTQPLTDENVIRVLRTINPRDKNIKKSNLANKFSPKQLSFMIIQAIKSEVKHHKRKDIYNICMEAEKQLRGEPVFGKFTNKAFIYDLKEATEDIKNSKVRSKIFEYANSLPTSEDNVYAFITKHDQSSPEKIAYDLFSPSRISVEHMHPISLGGPDTITNWAMACTRCNNSRQHKNMGVFYKQFSPENAQVYWDDIIADANRGYFDYNDVIGMLEIHKEQSGIEIDASKLKKRKSR